MRLLSILRFHAERIKLKPSFTPICAGGVAQDPAAVHQDGQPRARSGLRDALRRAWPRDGPLVGAGRRALWFEGRIGQSGGMTRHASAVGMMAVMGKKQLSISHGTVDGVRRSVTWCMRNPAAGNSLLLHLAPWRRSSDRAEARRIPTVLWRSFVNWVILSVVSQR